MDKDLIRIAHRGNTNGAVPEMENRISYLAEALLLGFWIECDIQHHDGHYYFGHDDPQEHIDMDIVMHSHTICHAKDMKTMTYLLSIGAHCFFHDVDSATLTSKGMLWCYPGIHPRHEKAIWLDLLDQPLPHDRSRIFGVCSDLFIE